MIARKLRNAGVALILAVGAANALSASLPAVEARHGMVVSEQRLASAVGVDILRQGGNAIDAAVAVGYALAVVHPCCGNLGGGGFMTLRLADGRTTFLDFREKAPAAAASDMYLDADGKVLRNASLDGYRAAAVPGSVLGLDTAWRRYGRLSRATVMAPAIRLAREGFVLTRGDTDILDTTVARLRRDPEAARIFLRPDGSPLQPGDRLVQTDLARTLTAIARHGPPAFYRGRIAQAVESASRRQGGILSAADFAAYAVAERAPVRCAYRGFVIHSAPPPSSGGTTLCESLNVLEGFDLKSMGAGSAQTLAVMTEAMRQAFLDRNTFLGDPDFVDVPLPHLLSRDYAKSIVANISGRARSSADLAPARLQKESSETTHYSIVDADGNAAAVTTTINGRFGAAVIAPGTGFFLNNEMDDFTVAPGTANLYGLVQGAANAIAPGKRPLSSMAPTLVTRDDRLFMALGSPGGARIISIVLQTLLNVIDHGMAPQEAVDAPRIHHQWLPDTVYYETRGLSPDTREALQARGYALLEQSPWGALGLIVVGGVADAARGTASSGNDAAVSGALRAGFLYGAADPRRPAGAALGY
ncbi:gamma-glutamyltransferase [Propionivibrio dicarboxylicus]|uniref:Glutathione hydrolase proenzyme n=1 Tax=Propionivibrio dicarboxylicus TaxID=83767 RepID=A0A1G8KA99_9RHOO|nr:gamma-glutamyltransferase [Propionivibrio dicarboxylicus]SDI40375.1 gamma-glutamyltranspeptidase / glutathione hydrolase [Propionivibrio dicarboxylicus]